MTSQIGRAAKQMGSNEHGLTLIELCLTLLILGLIVMAATPKLSRSFQDLRIQNIAEEVAADLVLCQQRAILTGHARRVKIWPDGRGYTIEHHRDQELPGQPSWSWQDEWQVELERTLASGTHLKPMAQPLEWTPAGACPDLVLRIKDGNEKVYEIRIENSKITVRGAGEGDL
ncbi:MAG: Tfp pilus assembly protein FimT/FimU [bacterium]